MFPFKAISTAKLLFISQTAKFPGKFFRFIRLKGVVGSP